MIAAMSKKRGRPVDPESKRSLGLDRHREPRLVLHAEAELLEALDDYLSSFPHSPGRSQVVRDFVRDALRAKGFYPPKSKSKPKESSHQRHKQTARLTRSPLEG